MTNAIVINDKNRTIVITKKFAATAKRYGTDEYKSLQEVRRDYPNYRVEVKTVSKKSDSFKGLTYAYMENYIRNHDKHEEMLKEFFILCGKTEEGEPQEFVAAASYGEIKKWFLASYKELNIQRKSIDDILKKNVTENIKVA